MSSPTVISHPTDKVVGEDIAAEKSRQKKKTNRKRNTGNKGNPPKTRLKLKETGKARKKLVKVG